MNKLTENNNFEITGNFYTKNDVIDLYKLQKQLLLEENIIASLEECANIWNNYSGDLAASWLFFPALETDILKTIRSSDFFTNFEDYSK